MKISQAMIVKNEERHIKRALEWGSSVMSEQIVVDTGSKDRTIELAKEKGAQVFSIPWQDDFSFSKNAAIERCKGDWIAFLDADEYIAKEDVSELPGIIERADAGGYDAISASSLDLDDNMKPFGGGTLVRFFKNQPNIRYHRCIHEQLSAYRVYDATKEINIYHTGYSASEKKRKPSDRNLLLIKKELSRNPKDDEMLGYLGDEYRARMQYADAVDAYQRAISFFPERLSESNQRAAVSMERLLELYAYQLAWQKDPHGTQSEMKRISFGEMQRLYDLATSRFPKESDYDYIMGEYFYGENEYDEAKRYYGKALQKFSQYGFENRALMLMPQLLHTYEKYAFCLFSTGEMKEAVKLATQCIREDHQSMLALKTLLLAFTVNGENEPTVDAIFSFLFKVYDITKLRDKMTLYYAAGDANCPMLKDRIFRSFSEEEQKALSQKP